MEGTSSNEDGSMSDGRPKITTATPGTPFDPVRAQRKKDIKELFSKRKLEVIPEKESVVSAKIQPSVGTRVGLKYVHEVNLQEGQPRIKYPDRPLSKKQQKKYEENRTNTFKEFCKYGSIKLPDPIHKRELDVKFQLPSPDVSSAKVTPRKVSPTSSWLYPDPPSKDALELKKPKSGIFVNESNKKPGEVDYDSFDLVYSRTPRPKSPKQVKQKKKSSKKRKLAGEGLEAISEADEAGDKPKKKKKKKRKKGSKKVDESPPTGSPEDNVFLAMAEEELAEGLGEDALESYLTKQFRRKVSQISKCTSYQSRDIKSIYSEEIVEEQLPNKYIQKFRRESEVRRYEPKKRKFKRGTLESHSYTSIHQPTLRDFFFGSREGTMHQGDNSYPAVIQNKQGLCMPVAAYCFSILKHPNKWTSENIDEILAVGNELCLESIKKLHMHNPDKELKPEELQKYCVIGEKKIQFLVDEPEISGFIRSDDKRVYNLTKALKIFFARQTSGILKTQDISIAIWKDKYYYLFDARPRTRDLFRCSTGAAIMANFYDVASMATVFLERSHFENWPFVIYNLKAFKILNKDDPEIESTQDLDIRSNYNILNENKAVVLASFDLADKCFDFTRNKQALAMATVCLVYSRITPPCAWHKTTLDKIMIIGNQLYLECAECDAITDLRLDNLPALFTVGPYIVEIYIYANMCADLLYKKCCCMLRSSFEEFFDKSSNGILQIGTCHLAVWKQRNMYYCFDPYSRNGEGFQCRDGAACVSMHANIESLVNTIATNFDSKDSIFYIHALKVCKIHRDPVQSARFPRHLTMEDFPLEDVKKYKMKKSRKPATEKPVTVDYSALAMRRLLAGESPDASLFEVGSTVESLTTGQIPPMVHKFPSRSVLRAEPKLTDVVADLDSPSLSDTQIEPPLPEQPKLMQDIEFMDLDSFVLTQEEIELQEIAELGEDYEGEEDVGAYGDYEGEGEENIGEEDWFYTMTDYTQVGQYSLPQELSRISEQINTDMTYFPIKRDVLYPTFMRGKQQMKHRLQFSKKKVKGDDWDFYYPPEPTVTRSEELRKETNFVVLPDDTEIIHGSKNVIEYGKDIEFIAPFVCIMAGVVAKKYSILSWTGEIVDYILKCGNELYGVSKFRYDQVSKLEIPRITLGQMNFKVLVEYVFDTYTRQNILELAIEKILFIRSDMGILVTPTYACTLISRNHLYYMYDAFGNNEVGLSEGPSNAGVACFARFKDIRALVTRIMYNKRKRESTEEVIYSRVVLSSLKVKMADPSQEESKKKKKRKKDKMKAAEEEELMQGDAEGGDETPSPDGGDEKGDAEESESEEEEEEDGRRRKKSKKALNKVGYRIKGGIYLIEGTKALQDRDVMSPELKEDHFVCVCACLMLLNCPVRRWDTKKVDQVIDHGRHVYSHADDLDVSEKRTIKNVLIQKNFFDIIVKNIKIENWRDNRNLSVAIDTLLRKKLGYFLVQFPNACYVIHKSQDETFHLFDPYGFPAGDKKDGDTPNQACWVKCQDLKMLKWRLNKLIVAGGRHYTFYTFEVTSITKAPKDVVLSAKLQDYSLNFVERKERLGKPFYEDVDWLKTDPIPWSRKIGKSAHGADRGKVDNMWNNWDIEYPNDLVSLTANIHQSSERFSEVSRGKQTLANLIVAIGMLEIYDLTEWNSAILDSILVNGDNYFMECIKSISDADYELSMEDLKEECSIFPFSFKVSFVPVIEGTMFLVRSTQFNLYKALRFFFANMDRRTGVICTTRGERKYQVAFGKIQESEYFMFDTACYGSPMFLDKTGVAYMLRMTTLNRLLHVLTLTLRGGDFFIYEVEVTDLKPIS